MKYYLASSMPADIYVGLLQAVASRTGMNITRLLACQPTICGPAPSSPAEQPGNIIAPLAYQPTYIFFR